MFTISARGWSGGLLRCVRPGPLSDACRSVLTFAIDESICRLFDQPGTAGGSI